jgi:23S rRNA (adenine2030-N6)-methyltransferase
MNYRHAYHAGNHGDVLKHIVLARALDLLANKLKPFFMLDAHAGPALHALQGREASKTGEWKHGVGRLFDAHGKPVALSEAAERTAAPWRRCVASLNPTSLQNYPGSAQIARGLLRSQDRLHVNELHPDDHAALDAAMLGDRRVKVSALDADVAIKSLLPPPERRGLVLIDPSYEDKREADRALGMLDHGMRRFATGAYLLWYPVIDQANASYIVDGARELDWPKTWLAELRVKSPQPQGGLAGSGLVMINPPWPLADELAALLPELTPLLAQGSGAAWRLEALRG